MYSTELLECPGCRNACPADRLTCGVGEKIFAQYNKKREQTKQAESQTKDSDSDGKAEG